MRQSGPAGSEERDESLKARRRRQIIEATIAAIYRRGIGDVRVADIARAAGVSYGVVSYYFKSKDKLILATVNHVAREYSDAMRAVVGDESQSPMARLLDAVGVSFTPSVSDPAKSAVWIALWSQSHIVPSFRKRCCELQDEFVQITRPLLECIVAEGGHDEIDPGEFARSLCILMSGVDIEMHLRGRNYSAAAGRRTFHELLRIVFPAEYAAATGEGAESRPRKAARG